MAQCGKKTEVYSRVVGYHRPVKNWNRGKREEFKERRTFLAVKWGRRNGDDVTNGM